MQIYLFVSTKYQDMTVGQTDRRTDTERRHMRLCCCVYCSINLLRCIFSRLFLIPVNTVLTVSHFFSVCCDNYNNRQKRVTPPMLAESCDQPFSYLILSLCRSVQHYSCTIAVTDVDVSARHDPLEVIIFSWSPGPGYGFPNTFPFLSSGDLLAVFIQSPADNYDTW